MIHLRVTQLEHMRPKSKESMMEEFNGIELFKLDEYPNRFVDKYEASRILSAPVNQENLSEQEVKRMPDIHFLNKNLIVIAIILLYLQQRR